MSNLPPELVRNQRQPLAWQASFPPPAAPAGAAAPFRYPLSDFMPPGGHGDSTLGSNLSEILDRTHIGPDQEEQPQASNWSRSYQNPVGTIYYPPSESENRWAWPASSQSHDSPVSASAAPKSNASPHNSTTPYINYYDMFRQADHHQPMFYDARQSYMSKPSVAKPPPMALGAFLPMPYRGSPQGSSQNFDISPKSRRSAKSQRPYSADVNQLFSVEEDGYGSPARSQSSFKKGTLFTI